jgi:hypothetical protein
MLLVILGVVDGILSFLVRNILNSENFMNWMGTVNFFVFGMAVIALSSLIADDIVSNAGIIGCLVSGTISAVVLIIGCIILVCTFIFTDISINFRSNMFLYYASPVIMIIAGIKKIADGG